MCKGLKKVDDPWVIQLRWKVKILMRNFVIFMFWFRGKSAVAWGLQNLENNSLNISMLTTPWLGQGLWNAQRRTYQITFHSTLELSSTMLFSYLFFSSTFTNSQQNEQKAESICCRLEEVQAKVSLSKALKANKNEKHISTLNDISPKD